DETAEIASVFTPESFIELSQMVEKSQLSSSAAKEVFNELLISDKTPYQIAEERNLLQVSDESAIAEIVDRVLSDAASQKSIEDFKSGQEKAIGYLVGQVMKQSQGKANPSLAQKLIREKI